MKNYILASISDATSARRKVNVNHIDMTHVYKKGSIMKHVLIGAISLVFLCTSPSAAAQDRWSLVVRGAANFATQDLGDADLDTGFGFEGTVAYRFMPHLAAYAGWGWNHFPAEQSFSGKDVDFEETGYTFGLQFMHPFGTSAIQYLIGAGGIYNHIEAENNDGDNIGDSDHGFGWQIEAGLSIPLGERWHVMPDLRYRSLSSDISVADSETTVDLNYLSAGVRISFSF
jgi:opacity protein-like surface antigen